MTENVEPAMSDRGPMVRTKSPSASVSGRWFVSLFTVLVVIAGLVFTSVQPVSADPSPSLVWTARTAAAGDAWFSVTYGNGMFVAVAPWGTDQVMTSIDGITWTARTAPSAGWQSVTYGTVGGTGLFVAVATGGPPQVMTSPAGITWTARTAASSDTWFSVTYGNGMFVAIAVDGGSDRVMTSSDGITWTARTAVAANPWYSVTYGNGMFVAVAPGGTNRVMTSTDGITWTAQTAASGQWNSVTYGNGMFVAIAADGGSDRVMTSTNGVTWTARTVTAENPWTSVTYGNGMFVAVAPWGTDQVMTSTDGITWTAQTAASGEWQSVTYAGGTFVAVGMARSIGDNRVMTGVSSAAPAAPAAPTSLVATPGNGSVSIAFTPGAAGTSAITKYQYQIGSGSWLDAPSGTTSPVVISGLTNYVVNSIKLRAYSADGAGTESSPVSVTPKVSAPTITSAYSGKMAGVSARGIVVGFTGVTSPGATMISYRINAYAKGTNTVVSTVLLVSNSRNDRTAFLSGLTAGVEYDIRVIGYLTLTGSPLVTRGTFESATRTVKV